MTSKKKTGTSTRRPRKPKATKEIASGLIVFRRTPEGLRFLLLYHGREYWNFPKGKIEREEGSYEAALREVKEETGLHPRDLRVVKNFKAHERFTFYRNRKRVFKVVILYLAETRVRQIRISDEHSGYGWFSIQETKKILSRYKENLTIITNANAFLQKKFSSKRKK